MSDIGSGARAALVADGTVNGLVAGRIYPEAMDQAATMPAIDYSEISSTAFNQLAGRSGLALSRLQFRCYAATRLAAVALRVEVRDALAHYRGTIGGEVIRGALEVGRHGGYQPPNAGSSRGRYFSAIDFEFSHTEAT